MANDLVVVFGGSGFVGKQVVRALAKRGKRIRIAMRRPHLGQDLRMLGDVGQIQLVQANVRFPESVDAALEDADAVVNLVAVLHEKGPQTFQALHVDAARTLAEAAKKRGILRFAQMSALGAAPKGSHYAKTKFAGEQAVRELIPTATVLRPSIIFGPEDHFFNRFAQMAQTASTIPLGGVPLIGGGKTKFQPVFVGDAADAMCAALDRQDARGRTYELGGPGVYSFKQLMQFILAEIDRRPILAPLPFVFAHPLGLLIEWTCKLVPFINPPLTSDQVAMLHRDSVVGADPNAGRIADLGVTSLETIEAIVPTYLWRFRPYGQFQTRQTA